MEKEKLTLGRCRSLVRQQSRKFAFPFLPIGAGVPAPVAVAAAVAVAREGDDSRGEAVTANDQKRHGGKAAASTPFLAPVGALSWAT